MAFVHNNFHIITGGPGAGKSTLIDALAGLGYSTVRESGRAIIRHQLAIGGNALHTGDRALFLELMIERTMADYEAASGETGPVFFDRGLPEFAGYCRLTGVALTAHVQNAAEVFRYNPRIFVAPPWREIYVNDAERKQDFAEAVATCDACAAACVEAGYEVVELPKASVAERVAFVLDQVAAVRTKNVT